MTEIIIFVGITLAVAAVCHGLIRNYWRATVLTAVISIALFLISIILLFGPLCGSAFISSVLVGWVGAFALSMVVGIPFEVQRRSDQRSRQGFCQTCGYNLAGNQSGVCPECGSPVPKQASEAS